MIRTSLNQQLNANLPLPDDVIDRLFPCGQECITFGHGEEAHNLIRTIAAVTSWIVFVFSLASCGVYLHLTRHEANRSVHGQLAFAFNVTFIIMAVGFLPATFASSRSFICFPDDTLRIGEPKTSFWCSFFGAMSYAGVTNSAILLACHSHQWVTVVKTLRGTSARNSRREKTHFRVYMATSFIVTPALTVLVLAKQQINGNPITGTCVVNFDNFFYLLSVPIMFFTVLAVVQLLYGVIQIYMLRRAFATNRKRTLQKSASGGESAMAVLRKSHLMASTETLNTNEQVVPSPKSKIDITLTRLIVRLFVYILSILAMAVVNVAFGILVQVDKEKWKEGTYKSVLCQALRKDNCPPLPKVDEAAIITLLVVFGFSGFVLSTWILMQDVRSKRKSGASQTRTTTLQASSRSAASASSPACRRHRPVTSKSADYSLVTNCTPPTSPELSRRPRMSPLALMTEPEKPNVDMKEGLPLFPARRCDRSRMSQQRASSTSLASLSLGQSDLPGAVSNSPSLKLSSQSLDSCPMTSSLESLLRAYNFAERSSESSKDELDEAVILRVSYI